MELKMRLNVLAAIMSFGFLAAIVFGFIWSESVAVRSLRNRTRSFPAKWDQSTALRRRT